MSKQLMALWVRCLSYSWSHQLVVKNSLCGCSAKFCSLDATPALIISEGKKPMNTMCPLIVRVSDFGDQLAGLECDISLRFLFLAMNVEPPFIVKADDVSPFSRVNAAFSLLQLSKRSPKGTIFIAVIDPGVGTAREPVLIQTERHTFIGPNNGIFGPVVERDGVQSAFMLDASYFESFWASQGLDRALTFDGRDLFSPAAALNACGVPVFEFGNEFSVARLETVKFEHGQILHVDKYGNLKVFFHIPWGARSLLLNKDLRVPLVRTFGEVAPGELLAYVGSSGILEIAIREGNAAEHLRVRIEQVLSIDCAEL